MDRPTTTTKTAREITVFDTIVTKHGRNFGTVEIESIERTGATSPSGMPWVRVTGYQSVNAGVCGPYSNDVRADETFDVVAG